MSSQGTTAYGPQNYPTGRWPDELSFDFNNNIIRLSAANNVNIDPFAHVQIVDYDLDPLMGPYTMTLNLPIMSRLPNNGRLFLFYVNECQNLDVLTFTVVTGSGDTVNGNLVSFSFNLTGVKTLFFCVAINGNYIIHQFGGGSASPAVPVPSPLIMYRGVTYNGPLTYTPNPFPNPIQSWPGGLVAISSNQWTPTFDPTIHISGMDGYITPAVGTVPVVGLKGFLVNVSGLYRVTYAVNGLYSGTDSANVVNTIGGYPGSIISVDNVGGYLDGVSFGTSFTEGSDPTQVLVNGMCTRVMHLPATSYITGGVYFPTSFAINGQWGGQVDYSTFTFELLKQDPAPGPELFALAAPGSSADAVDGTDISITDQSFPAARRIQIQKDIKAAADLASQQQAYASSSSAQQRLQANPQISLSDVETIVRQVMRAQQQQSSVPSPSPASGVIDRSAPLQFGSISSSSSGPPVLPLSRKRARISEKEKE